MTSIAPPAGESEPPAPTARPSAALRALVPALGRGLSCGVLLGAAYRAFMRLLATQPEFSWSGTLFIVGSVAVLTVLVSVAATARARWRSRSARGVMRSIAVLAFVLVLQGQGAITAPTVILGGLALGRTSWPRWERIALAVLALAGLAVLPVLFWQDLLSLGATRSGAAILLYVALMGAFVRLFAVPTGSTDGRWIAWPAPSAARAPADSASH